MSKSVIFLMLFGLAHSCLTTPDMDLPDVVPTTTDDDFGKSISIIEIWGSFLTR